MPKQTYKAKYARWRYWERRRYGMCVHCPKKALLGKSLCADCAKHANTWREDRTHQHARQTMIAFQRRSEIWTSSGQCSLCGDERDRIDRKRCASCRQKEADRRARQRDNQALKRIHG